MKNIVIVTQVKVFLHNNGYYADSSFAKIIERYHKSFGKVCLVTRVLKTDDIKAGYIDISDCCEEVFNVGSVARFLFSRIDSRLKTIIKNADFVVLRVPSMVSMRLYNVVKKAKKIYMTEVIGCAWDAYWNHSLLGKIIAPFMLGKMKRVVRGAKYSVYVTQEFLQRRYPCRGEGVGVSDVCIDKIDAPKTYKNFDRKNITIMTAGAVNVKYKGQRYVIRAMEKLKKRGINAKYYLAGKGDNDALKKLAKRCGVSKDVIFLGMLSRNELAGWMKKIDIYIQPSLQEGLPRSLLEAMSYGCVCLGANTGGIPELLDKKNIFRRGKTEAVYNSIISILDEDFSIISADNAKRAGLYKSSLLDKTRNGFYKKINKEMGFYETTVYD